jgi:uncharacterized damage-inducible protein DinB
MSQAQVLLAAALALWVPSLFAQDSGDAAVKVQLWKTSKEFTLAVADAMPLEHYGFKPDKDEMTFGALMVHIASSQAFRFAQVAGEPMPLKLPKEFPKEEAKAQIRQLLEQSFDYCIQKVQAFTPAQLEKSYKVAWYGRPEVNGHLLVMGMFTHTAHHRGQAEVYLRSKGIKPPEYRF